MSKVRKILSAKNATFGVIFVVAFAGSLYLFSHVGLVPEGVSNYAEATNPVSNISAVFMRSFEGQNAGNENNAVALLENFQVPRKVVIDKIGVDAPILNPSVSDNKVLNKKLKEGVVRYPDSGLLGDKRNMLLLGHASTLPGVQNEMYKVFSKIRQLNIGDRFKVYSEDKVFFYKVVEMTLTNKNEAKIDFNTGKRQITLSTCNTLGEKDERFVVRADFVESFPLDE